MRTWKSKETDRNDAFDSDAARDDWNRYGAHHAPAAGTAPNDAMGRPITHAGRREDPRDDIYLEYRREKCAGASEPQGSRRSRRFVANVAGASVVALLGVVGLGVGLATAPPGPSPSASPTSTAVASAQASAQASAEASGSGPPSRTSQASHVGVLIDLPLGISTPNRDQQPDDGRMMFLTGPKGGVAIDPGTGSVTTVYGGSAFAGGMRRTIVEGGLWLSSWPSDATFCGPSCWGRAATYRLDLGTGNVTNAYPGMYLIGAAPDGVVVATGNVVERLDQGTGNVLATTPWHSASEPRVGCGSLWSYTPGSKTASIDLIAPATGAALGRAELDPGSSYGPTSIEGRCWMMSGSGGASAGSTTLVWLSPSGKSDSILSYPGKSIVTLNGEFWLYAPDGSAGLAQRFEATAGVGYGPIYRLPVRPPNDDPMWLFSAANTLWMIDGTQLVGFDITTGATGSAGG